MQVDINVIKELNSKASAMNEQRSRMLGVVEHGQKEYESKVAAYEKEYGVKLTMETIQSEYDSVSAEVAKRVEELQIQLKNIESGEYKKAKPVTKAVSVPVSQSQTAAAPPVVANASPVIKPSATFKLPDAVQKNIEATVIAKQDESANAPVPQSQVVQPNLGFKPIIQATVSAENDKAQEINVAGVQKAPEQEAKQDETAVEAAMVRNILSGIVSGNLGVAPTAPTTDSVNDEETEESLLEEGYTEDEGDEEEGDPIETIDGDSFTPSGWGVQNIDGGFPTMDIFKTPNN